MLLEERQKHQQQPDPAETLCKLNLSLLDMRNKTIWEHFQVTNHPLIKLSSIHARKTRVSETTKPKRERIKNPDNTFKRDGGEAGGGGVGPLRLQSQFEDLVMQNLSSATDSSHGNCELPKFLVDKWRLLPPRRSPSNVCVFRVVCVCSLTRGVIDKQERIMGTATKSARWTSTTL